MKRAFTAASIGCSIAGLLSLIHCSQPATSYTAPGSAGASSAGSGATTAGASPSAGSPGTAGSAPVQAGSAGMPAASGAGGTDSAVAGSSSGGSAGTATGTAGSGGAGGSAVLSVDDVFGIKNAMGEHISDSYILFPCYGKAQQDCITIPSGAECPNQNNTALPYEERGVQTHEYFHIGGVVGQMYVATIHVDGITEAKYYENGTCTGSDTPATCSQGRAAGLGDPPAAAVSTTTWKSCGKGDTGCIDAFYTGGDPVDFEHYNVYKVIVYNTPDGADGGPGQELQHYYLNSFPKTAQNYEQHSTYFISYTHDIIVPGGGVIEYKTADQNCHAIDNCGPGYFTTDCTATNKNAGRKIDGLTIPSKYMGLNVSTLNATNGANQPYHSHVLHITVTAVKPM